MSSDIELIQKIVELEKEVERLKHGHFTDEEYEKLRHKFNPEWRKTFIANDNAITTKSIFNENIIRITDTVPDSKAITFIFPNSTNSFHLLFDNNDKRYDVLEIVKTLRAWFKAHLITLKVIEE